MAKIVVGYDGSDASRDAVRFAVEEGELRRVLVEVVHAWTAPPAPPVDSIALTPEINYYPELLAQLRDGAEQRVAVVVDEVTAGKQDVQVEGVAIEGAPAAVLLDEAEREALMVVVGSRGRGGFARLLLGSVSEQVARHAPCPVVIHRTRRNG
jgi:nucleotide-binding universal stress UspA family protein